MIFYLNISKVHYVTHTVCKHGFSLANTLYVSTEVKENRKNKYTTLVCFCEVTVHVWDKRNKEGRSFSSLAIVLQHVQKKLMVLTKLKRLE